MRRLTLVVLIAYYSFGVELALAQTPPTSAGPVYPAKPLRLLFGYTAGGAGDVSARLLAHKLYLLLSSGASWRRTRSW